MSINRDNVTCLLTSSIGTSNYTSVVIKSQQRSVSIRTGITSYAYIAKPWDIRLVVIKATYHFRRIATGKNADITRQYTDLTKSLLVS